MIKILVFGLSNHLGGIESFFHNYFMHVDHKKYHFDFVAPEGAISYQDDYEKYNSKIFKVPFYLKNPVKYFNEIRKIFKYNDYDVVYVNMLSAANIIPLKLAYDSKITNIIAHSHNADVPSNIIRKILHKINVNKIPKYSNNLIACSDKAGKFMFNKNRYRIIKNAIDSDKFMYSVKTRNYLRKKHDIKNSDYVIGHIGRFCEQKNQFLIIKLAEEIKKNNNSNVKFILFGEGETKNIINEYIFKNKVDNIIIFNSNKEICKYYNMFDMFILPSLFEGLPVVGIEAQFNGLPSLFSSNITRQLKFNKNTSFLDINDLSKWTKEIYKNKKRIKPSPELIKEYGISFQINVFTDILRKGLKHE